MMNKFFAPVISESAVADVGAIVAAMEVAASVVCCCVLGKAVDDVILCLHRWLLVCDCCFSVVVLVKLAAASKSGEEVFVDMF